MSEFRFKKFSVKNERSAMKVNTDGVLLGAAASIGDSPLKVLDAGTGTGTIALMIAQRMEEKGILEGSSILGIDIDEQSAYEAEENFRRSPWKGFMECRHLSLSECEGSFDLIISNPPFFDGSLPNPDIRKKLSRHTSSPDDEGHKNSPLSFRSLVEYAKGHLSDNGTLAMILPSGNEPILERFAPAFGLHIERSLRIRTVPSKEPSRVIVHLKKNLPSGTVPKKETLTVQDRGEYTPEYRSLVKDFYL